MDKHEFDELMGAKPQPEETPEEQEAREARMEAGEATMEDVFSRANIERVVDEDRERKKAILDHYSLNDRMDEETEAHRKAMYSLLSEEQKKQFKRAEKTYRKRRLPAQDKNDPDNNLLTFAATNPPEILSKHIWRLQRGMDEPMWGTELEPPPSRVRHYRAALIIELCDRCADELYEETNDSGAEEWHRPPSDGSRWDALQRKPFYGRKSEAVYNDTYQFRYEDLYVEQEVGGSLFGFDEFPYAQPMTCARCGLDDADLWRERFGSADDNEA
jgi:hypothetical protein